MKESIMRGLPDRREVYTLTPGVNLVLDALALLMERPYAENHAYALPILGPAGWGKTEVVVQFCHEELRRREAEGRSFRCAFVRLPGTASPRNIASRTLDTLGDPAPNVGSAASMTLRAVNLLMRGQYDLLIYDDVDNLIDQETDRVVQKAAAWLQEILNSIKTPIVMTGTEKFVRVLEANDFLRRRCATLSPVRRLDWRKDIDLNVFRVVADDIQNAENIQSAISLSERSTAMRLCYASFGLVGLTVRLVREAADYARRRGGPVDNRVFQELVSERRRMGDRLGVNPFDLPDEDLESMLRANALAPWNDAS